MANELTTLSALAIEINALDEQANYHAGQAVIYAAKCGEKLLLAKAQCRHGEWLGWLDVNCRLKDRQAAKYMKLAAEMPNLLSSNSHPSANLPGINQAIELLSAPEEVKAEVQERLDAGEAVTVKEIQELKRKAADMLTIVNMGIAQWGRRIIILIWESPRARGANTFHRETYFVWNAVTTRTGQILPSIWRGAMESHAHRPPDFELSKFKA